MVNVSEPTLNLVTYHMPKMLIGMNQNGEWVSLRAVESRGKDIRPTGGKSAPNLPSSLMRNTVSPYSRPQGKADRKER